VNRRTLLKNTGLLAAGAIGLPSFKTMGAENIHNSRYFGFPFGEIEILIVTDGHGLFKPAQPIFAPGIPAAAFEAVQKENFLPPDAVDIAFNVMVVKTKKDIILFDTGCGASFGPASGHLPEGLRAAGIDSADVTAILMTHAHPDHIGGLLDKGGRPVFPYASVHIAAPEYDFWTGATPDFSKNKFPDHGATASWVQLATKGFEAYRDRLHLFHDGSQLSDGIRARIVPGHTPGHTLFTITSGNESIIHMGDTAHDHVVLLSHPEWGVGFDTDFEKAAQARRKILEELAEERHRIFSCHLPWPGLGHVRRRDKGYEWVAQAFATV